MSNPKKLAKALLFAGLIGAGVVIACGPDFPAQLLDDRGGTLHATPSNSFRYEAARLTPATDALRARDTDPYYQPPQAYIPEDDDPELDATQRNAILNMRAQADGDAAYAAGAGVPEAARLYAAGAVDYLLAQREPGGLGEQRLARAQRRFQAILALPAAQSVARSVWASYMLADIGDISSAIHDDAAARAQTAKAYEHARELARAGAPDPLGLAVASYGQQARLLLTGAQGECSYIDLLNDTPCMDAVPAAALKQAIRLYAEQAARGSSSGHASLRLLASWALGKPERARALIDDPVSQGLLVSYALARLGDIVDGQPDSAFDAYANFDATGQPGLADSARGAPNVEPNPTLKSLVSALQALDVRQVANADRVAALAYRIGRYDLAQSLASRLDTALAWWVRAKLALRQGDSVQAAQAYARAAAAFPRADGSLDADSAGRLRAEQGVLTLSRGQYVEALDQLLRAGGPLDAARPAEEEGWPMTPYWNDAAYVAERVLTLDELKQYVDAQAPATPAPARPKVFDLKDGDDYYGWARQHPVPTADRLRLLLARRMVREGMIDQAVPYFPAEADPRFARMRYDAAGVAKLENDESRSQAAAYAAALREAGNGWGRTGRAQAWHQAGLMARRHGMEIMGYEEDPDYAVYDGSYTYGAGRNYFLWTQEHGNAIPATPAQRAEAALPGPYVTQQERERYAASEARPYARFHYRQIAASHMMKAADELPARSQAYAAVLCQGTRFVINDAPDVAAKMYRRYVETGAVVPFSGSFGQECAEPDFKGAARFHYVQAWKAWERLRHDHPGRLLAAGLLALAAAAAGVALWVWRARRGAQG